MYTINGSPYITLDNFIDIKRFLELEDEFNFIINSNWNYVRTGIWSAGGHDPDNLNNIYHEKDLLYFVHERAKKERLTNPDLDLKVRYFEERNDKAGLARFYKLKYKAIDPYCLLNLRTTTSGVYSSDARFTREQWDSYKWVDIVDKFPKIKNFITGLPLDEIGAVTIFYNEHYVPLGYHRDLNYFPLEFGNNPNTFPHRQEFIWLRFNLDRPFYLYDIEDNKITNTIPVQGHSAFFHHHNWHGNFNANPYASLTVKVEGKFSDTLRTQMGIDHLNVY